MSDLPAVPDGETLPAVPEDIEKMLEDLRPQQQVYLRALFEFKCEQDAYEVTGTPASTHRTWRHRYPEYREASEAVDQCINAWLRSQILKGGTEGIRKRKFSGEGKLLEERIEQDPTLLLKHAAGRMPDEYGRGEQGDPVIVVQVIGRPEGKRYFGPGSEGYVEDIEEAEYMIEEGDDG